jgi:hypothetical protein
MKKQLFIASFDAINGQLLKGPVSVDENDEYHFQNKNSADDIYFLLKKSHDGWHFSGGPSTYIVPRQFIDAVGEQIDYFNDNND